MTLIMLLRSNYRQRTTRVPIVLYHVVSSSHVAPCFRYCWSFLFGSAFRQYRDSSSTVYCAAPYKTAEICHFKVTVRCNTIH